MAATQYTVLKEFTDDRACLRYYPKQMWVGESTGFEVFNRLACGEIGSAAGLVPPVIPVGIPYPATYRAP